MTDNPVIRARTPMGEDLILQAAMPLLPVRDAVVFPGMTVPLAVGRAGSLAALDAAGAGGLVIIGTQRDPHTEDPGLEELYEYGCIGRLVRVVDTRGGGKQAVVVGLLRVRIRETESVAPHLRVRFEAVEEAEGDDPASRLARQRVLELAHRVIDLRDDYPNEWKQGLTELPNASMLADLIASNLPLSPEQRIEFLRQGDPVARLGMLTDHLEREVTIAETQRSFQNRAEGEDDPAQRERLLRRRMRDIQAELGESDLGQQEVDELRDRLDEAGLPEEAQAQADRELKRLVSLAPQAPERHLIRTYLDWMADLPWSVETEDHLDLSRAREILDEDHHGLDKVKERILEYLAVRKLAPDAKAPILCFVGPPGVGKTSLGRSIARALDRRFARASLGGVRDEAEIRGHRRTYVGSLPGRVLQSLRRAGSRNPVFLLDEIDKLGADFRGDPSSALLEVLDPEQNQTFSDHYLEVSFDLSRVLFIATANTRATIPPALLDRMEVIELPGYTDAEKRAIARTHLVPKQSEGHGLDASRVLVEDDAIELIVEEYTREAGVRNLERHVASLMRKAAAKIAGADETPEPLVIDAAFAKEALGAPPHLPETAERTTQPGVVVGLAATTHGGDILFIEATAIAGGKGVRLRLTGQLGDVMRESAETALSWVRANAEELGLDSDALGAGEIHVHVPAGATPKDGPSAGVALASAIVSVLSGRRAAGNLAMTGELSLRGRVLPVGGIKEKLLAAARSGIDTVILPKRNEKDLVEVPEDVRKALTIIPVEEIGDVLHHVLEPKPA